MLHTLLKSSILKLLIIQNVPVEMKLHETQNVSRGLEIVCRADTHDEK